MPDGISVEDASEVLSEERLFEFAGSFSAFSNLFRYRLLYERGGWWVDTDVYCMHERIPSCSYAWARQDTLEINGAILRFPPLDPALAAIVADAERIGSEVTFWGQVGPDLLTRHLDGREFADRYGTTADFYPIHFNEAHLFWLPDGLEAVLARCRKAPFIHLWGAMFRQFGIDLRIAPPAGSFLQHIYDRSDYPELLPDLEESTRGKMEASVTEFLKRAGVRARSR